MLILFFFLAILCRPEYSDPYSLIRIQLFSIPCLKIIITGAVLFFLLSWSNLGGLERAVLSKQLDPNTLDLDPDPDPGILAQFGSGSRSRVINQF